MSQPSYMFIVPDAASSGPTVAMLLCKACATHAARLSQCDQVVSVLECFRRRFPAPALQYHQAALIRQQIDDAVACLHDGQLAAMGLSSNFCATDGGAGLPGSVL